MKTFQRNVLCQSIALAITAVSSVNVTAVQSCTNPIDNVSDTCEYSGSDDLIISESGLINGAADMSNAVNGLNIATHWNGVMTKNGTIDGLSKYTKEAKGLKISSGLNIVGS